MPENNFPHISLLCKVKGTAKLEGGGSPNPRVVENSGNNRQGHSQYLGNQWFALRDKAIKLKAERSNANLPEIKGGVPFLLQIPDEDDGVIEFLSEVLGLEIVAEYDDGYLIVATGDFDSQKIQNYIDEFSTRGHGSGKMANILEIDDDPLSENRIKRILDEKLHELWPFQDDAILILDISIETQDFGLPKKPRISSRTNPEVRLQKEQAYAQELEQYLARWEEIRMDRESEVEAFVQHYHGEICSITDDSHIVQFPDSFSVRIKMSGQGFKDLINNYPNLFEVNLPDDIEQPKQGVPIDADEQYDFEALPPGQDAGNICIIDSGIQENHKWVSAAIDKTVSYCFLPNTTPDDVADYVSGGGHGTRVAGAALFPNEVPKAGELTAPFWLINARVLDNNCFLSERAFPAALLTTIVKKYSGLKGTRIYNHSIGSKYNCRRKRMSTWAAAIDSLSYSQDVLFIQAAGNLRDESVYPNRPGILNYIQNGIQYPDYLFEDASGICNPAQSLQAITVGSISKDYYSAIDQHSVSPNDNPSSFTRTGFGLWGSIKPEVVEFGGDNVIDTGNPPSLTTPPEVCPELIRTTLQGGPAFSKDAVGTSFAAPKVAHIAGVLQSILPQHNTLLYRALIVNSARWPSWMEEVAVLDRAKFVKAIGFGVPDISRATQNTVNRVTLITDTIFEIRAKEGLVFGIPIPEELRRPGQENLIRIDVTLSYAAEPRRTRKSRRGYLGVWLDWKASKRSENFDTFKARALKEADDTDTGDDGNFIWVLGNKANRDGETDGVTRKNGTVQKDWTYAQSYELPDVFGIVVRGHEGWDRLNDDATAKFSLVVSFEAVNADVEIYDSIRQAVEIEAQQEVEELT